MRALGSEFITSLPRRGDSGLARRLACDIVGKGVWTERAECTKALASVSVSKLRDGAVDAGVVGVLAVGDAPCHLRCGVETMCCAGVSCARANVSGNVACSGLADDCEIKGAEAVPKRCREMVPDVGDNVKSWVAREVRRV
jgi:hypothetical protein